MRFVLYMAIAAVVGCASTPPAIPTPAPRDEASSLFYRASFFAERGDSVRAEQYFVAAMREGYPEDRVLPHLLRTCLQASRLRAARTYAESYVLRHPEAHAVRTLLASLHLALGDTDAARSELEYVLTFTPTHATAHFLLAVIARDFALDACGARAEFTEYLALAPDARRAAEARRFLAGRACVSETQSESHVAGARIDANASHVSNDASAPNPVSPP